MNDFIKNIEDKIDNAYNPKQIEVKKINSTILNKIKDNDQLVIEHSLLNIIIKVRKEFSIDKVLNIPTVFYSIDKFIIEDSYDNIFGKHNLSLSSEEMLRYIEDLLNAKDIIEFRYIRTLKENNIHLNDIIEFENGVKGVISKPTHIANSRNLNYIHLKKNGTLSKVQPRLIYNKDEYKVIGKY